MYFKSAQWTVSRISHAASAAAESCVQQNLVALAWVHPDLVFLVPTERAVGPETAVAWVHLGSRFLHSSLHGAWVHLGSRFLHSSQFVSEIVEVVLPSSALWALAPPKGRGVDGTRDAYIYIYIYVCIYIYIKIYK